MLSQLQELQLLLVIFTARLNDVPRITIFPIIILTVRHRPRSHKRFLVDYLHGILIITATAVIAAVTIFTLVKDNVGIKVRAIVVVIVIRRTISVVVLLELCTHIVVIKRGRSTVVIIHRGEL